VTVTRQKPVLRADLHVHSHASTQSGSMKFLRSRDCYSHPADVYRTAKARGMDVVTITDHDSIAGCLEFLSGNPGVTDFFVSEEVSCRFPGADIEVHLGVYGMTERLHRELQPLRRDVFEVAAALREAGVFFSLNHLLHFYRRQVPLARYLRLLAEVPALEARNGAMLRAHNELIERIAAQLRSGLPLRLREGTVPAAAGPIGMVAGSDAHTLRRIGSTWTAVPADGVEGFLAGLAAGWSHAGGLHGSTWSVAADAYSVIGSYVASLAGYGPRDHAPLRRAGCLLFSAASVPAQVLPLLITWRGKAAEHREVRRAAAELAAWLEGAAAGTAVGVEA
jgi:predicted metal-dependent phosphoesterase TrpH